MRNREYFKLVCAICLWLELPLQRLRQRHKLHSKSQQCSHHNKKTQPIFPPKLPKEIQMTEARHKTQKTMMLFLNDSLIELSQNLSLILNTEKPMTDSIAGIALQDYIGISDMLTGATISIIVWLAQNNYIKRSTCLELYKVWSSPEMYRVRRETYDWIMKNPIEKKDENGKEELLYCFNPRHIEKHEKEISINIGIISHFISNINSLLDEGMIHQKLTYRLFGGSMRDWHKIFECTHANGKFLHCTDEEISRYNNQILPLGEKLMKPMR